MGLQKCGLNLNDAGKELKPHGTVEFPCAGYHEFYTDKPEKVIPWHWHEELEILYIKDGRLRLQLPAEVFCLGKGDMLVINSNIPHYAAPDSECELQSLVFSPWLITGNRDSVFAKKYMIPLMTQASFRGFLIKAGDCDPAINDFVCAFEALAEDRPGFEFTVREKLSCLCFYLYQQFEKEIAVEISGMSLDSLRIKRMLDYLHHNFSGNISLSDIAGAANIGERECLRCFQRTIQLSPMQYLLKYRIMRGAELLLKNPTDSISEIAVLCGFDSPSNFAKMFKRFYNYTPRDYRKER